MPTIVEATLNYSINIHENRNNYRKLQVPVIIVVKNMIPMPDFHSDAIRDIILLNCCNIPKRLLLLCFALAYCSISYKVLQCGEIFRADETNSVGRLILSFPLCF